MKVSLYACLFLQNLSLSGGFSHDFAGKINSLLFLLSWPSPAPRRPLYKGLVKSSLQTRNEALEKHLHVRSLSFTPCPYPP